MRFAHAMIVSGQAVMWNVENADVEQEAERALNRETSEDDTHPSPFDRFRFTSRIVSQSEPPLSGMVWDLFKNREGLTTEMTSLIQVRLQESI